MLCYKLSLWYPASPFFGELALFAIWPCDLAYKPSSSTEQQTADEGGTGGIDFWNVLFLLFYTHY